MILDMIPGIGRAGDAIDLRAATRFWHVFFHGGNPDVAAKLVGQDVRGYLTHFYTSPDYNYSPAAFAPADVDEYVRVYSAPGALRAGFQYYATGIREDTANLAGCTRKLGMPVLAWGGAAFLADIVPAWRLVADDVRGGEVAECGHFIPEEKPELVIAEALAFFAARGDG
jgi:pimeloyl-ACP methyl ester carboxylesterase